MRAQRNSSPLIEEYIYNGIDRVDNLKGYEINNCVSCCKICNRAKNNMFYEDFMEWIKRLVTFQSKEMDEAVAKGDI